MDKKYLLFLLVIVVIACKQQVPTDSATVIGTYKGAEGKTILFQELKPSKILTLDSAIINKNDQFTFQTIPTQKSFYLLRLENSNPVSMVLDKRDTITISIDTAVIKQSYLLEGNHDSRLLRDSYKNTGLLKSKIDSLSQLFFMSQHLDTFYLLSAHIEITIERLINKKRRFTDSLIRSNSTSLAALLLSNQTFAGESLFNMEDNQDLFLLIDKNLTETYPNNAHVIENHKRVKKALRKIENRNLAASRISPGNQVPEISLPDIDGNQKALSDLQGKNIVLFFWASWSPESRADIQQLKVLYQDYKNQGLEVYAVSLDHKEKFWKAAVQIENTGWIHVSDGSGINGPVSSLFSISEQLPYYYLIDANRIIQYKTGDFSELKKALEQLTGSD